MWKPPRNPIFAACVRVAVLCWWLAGSGGGAGAPLPCALPSLLPFLEATRNNPTFVTNQPRDSSGKHSPALLRCCPGSSERLRAGTSPSSQRGATTSMLQPQQLPGHTSSPPIPNPDLNQKPSEKEKPAHKGLLTYCNANQM